MNTIIESATTRRIELGELHPAGEQGPLVVNNMQCLRGVKVTLTARVGSVETTLGDLMNMHEHSIVKLDQNVDAPIDLLVEGNVVARGHLVAVDDSFGIQLIEVAALQV